VKASNLATKDNIARPEVFTTMKIQVAVFCVVIHIASIFTLKVEAARPFETCYKPHYEGVYMGNADKGLRILYLGTWWRRVVSFTLRSLYPQRKNPSYLLDRRLRSPQSRYGGGG
jgi:hypothetical protein